MLTKISNQLKAIANQLAKMDHDLYITIERVVAVESVLNINMLLPHQAELLNKSFNVNGMEIEEHNYVADPNIKDNIVKKQVAKITLLKETLKTILTNSISQAM